MNENIQNNIRPELIRKISDYIQLNESQLSVEIQRLERQNKISVTGVISFLGNFEIVEDTSFRLISCGISRHFKRDYVSSVHILVPQIETILRLVLVHKNIISATEFSQKNRSINETLLHTLLRQSKVREFLGESLSTYLEVKFTEQLGLNLRNRVSHGLLDSVHDCNHLVSFSLIVTLIILLMKSYSIN